MLKNIYWLLKIVRENILENFVLPELNISYWDFCIYLAIAGVVIVVLINAVRVSGTLDLNAKRESNYRNVLRERERVKADERSKISNKGSSFNSLDISAVENYINNK